MRKPRVLFVHVPHKRRLSSAVNLMSAGTFALADLLHRQGFFVEIINMAVERICDPEFNLPSMVKDNKFDAVCIALHWHYQSWNVLSTVVDIKKVSPKVTVVLGGYTASIFAREIMEKHEGVDFIIRGEAEKPILQLFDDSVNNNSVPNLVYRDDNGNVAENEFGYVAQSKELQNLSYANFSLMRNFQTYIRIPETGISFEEETELMEYGKFFVSVGRGCSVQCFYCGGGKNAQKRVTGRTRHIFRPRHLVLEEIRSMESHGISEIVFDFDPEPNGDYYIELFNEMRTLNLDIKVTYASWSLPSKRLMEAVRNCGFREVEFIISPDFGSEEVRKNSKGMFFKNRDYFKLLTEIDRLNMVDDTIYKVTQYFFVGGPAEEEEDLRKSYEFAKRALYEHSCIYGIIAQVPQVEPASPMSEGCCESVKSNRITFADYLSYSRQICEEGANLDCQTLMGFTHLKLSPDVIMKWAKKISSLGLEAASDIHVNAEDALESLDDVFRATGSFTLCEYRVLKGRASMGRRYALVKRYSQERFQLTDFDLAVYRLLVIGKPINEALANVSITMGPVNPEEVTKAFFLSLKNFILQGALERVDRE